MRAFLPLALLFTSTSVQAAELTWDGHYRARGLLYDSLSLSQEFADTEGTRAYVDHRFRISPGWLLSERVGLYAQVDALNLVPWGSTGEYYLDPVTQLAQEAAWGDTQTPPVTDDEEGTLSSQAIALTRAWGEVYTDLGRLRFGRVPLEWGTGMYLNDGLALDAEYGDTSDRVQFITRAGPVYVLTAWEVELEELLNSPDGMQTANLGILYRSEAFGAGLLNRYRYQPSQAFNAYIGDLWLMASLGSVAVETEVVAVFGAGNLSSTLNDQSIRAVGALLKAEAAFDKLSLGLEAGLATGDADPNDTVIKTFSFDRDHNVSLLLFEEPMPVFDSGSTANGGEDRTNIRTGEGISNALYLRPHVGYKVLPQLNVDLAAFAAQAAKLPESESSAKGYGSELDLTLRYEPFEHFAVQGTGALLFPGKYLRTGDYMDEIDETSVRESFDTPVFGGMLMGSVRF